jgi:DNA repair protein SbcC/Rad50
MIKSIRLKNWKTHSDSTFTFGKGTNVIVGSIGSGKSSVMDAICYCLYGTTPAINSRRVSTEEVITQKPNKMDSSQLSMEFSYNGKEYAIERILKRNGTNEATLYGDGKLLAGPKTSDVNTAIEGELELGYELFSRAVYSEQNQIDFFLKLAPSQRKEKFDQLLELDKYEKARSNAVSLTNRIKTLAQDKKNWVEQTRARIKPEDIRDLQNKIVRKKEENQKAEKEIENTQTLVTTLLQQMSELETKEKEHKELYELRVKAQAQIEMHQKEVVRIREHAGQNTLAELENALKTCTHRTEQLEQEMKNAEQKKTACQERLNSAVQQGMVFAAQVKELHSHEQELAGLGGVCPTCTRELEQHTKEELLKKSRITSDELITQQKTIADQKIILEQEMTGHRRDEQTLKEELRANQDTLRECQQKHAELKGLTEKETALTALSEEVTTLGHRLTTLAFDERALIEHREKTMNANARMQLLEKEIIANTELVLQIEKQLQEVEKQQQQLKEMEGDVQHLEQGAVDMGFFVNALKAAQSDLRETLIETINEAMQTIWPKLYPYQDYISSKMVIENGSYELKVQQRNNEWVRVEGILSGGERAAAALCIRIAFSLVLTQNVSLMILDEPTHNLDGKAVRELSEMLRFYLPGLVEQIFIITHDKQMEQAANASVFILHREKDHDGFTHPEHMNAVETN